MTLPPSRHLYAVPRTAHVHLEIAKAIRTLGTQYDEEPLPGQADVAGNVCVSDLAKEIVREIWRELCKAGFRPDQPRWPQGSGEISGRWSGGAGEAPPAPPKPPPADLPPRSWRIGHNQGPPLDDPPDIPPEKPATETEILDFAKAAARWLGRAGLRRVLEVSLEATVGGPVGDFLLAMEATYWLYQYLPYIYAYLDQPKTWEELQQNRGTGYDQHHVVERWSEKDGIPRSMIYAPGNEVPIPTLKRWEINSWLGTPSPEFTDSEGNEMSPREYLKGKSWEERRRVGINALIRFGVLKP